MLDTVTTAQNKDPVDEFLLGIGFIFCVVDKYQKSIGIFHEFYDAVDKAEKWAKYYPSEAPFSIEKREKLWFSDRSIRQMLEVKSK